MDRNEFIKDFASASDKIDPERIEEIVKGCNERIETKFKGRDWQAINAMSVMEESAELIEAVSRRVRGRAEDNYDILQETADVVLGCVCAGMMFGFGWSDICRAVNVKADREEGRIEDYRKGLGNP